MTPQNPFEQFWKEYSQAKVVQMSRKDLAQDAFQIGMSLGMNLSKMFMVNDVSHPTEIWFNNNMAVQLVHNEMGYPVLAVGERKSNVTEEGNEVGSEPEGSSSES